jgi:4-hydroxy-3-polyprenylbenzoate decarboxylase
MRIIIGISGASGAILGVELLKALQREPGVETHLVISRHAVQTLALETRFSLEEVKALASVVYACDDVAAAIASGSFRTAGMAVVPCSMRTLAAIANGLSDNLLHRAADVCLKEGRKVVLVPREMPLSRVQLRNLLAASEAGCAIVPPMLTFYHKPETIQDMIDAVIAKVFAQFEMEYAGFKGWTGG